jgi:hypothetical protein
MPELMWMDFKWHPRPFPQPCHHLDRSATLRDPMTDQQDRVFIKSFIPFTTMPMMIICICDNQLL